MLRQLPPNVATKASETIQQAIEAFLHFGICVNFKVLAGDAVA